jgi:4-azaleucine resistance transporter AzlC
VDEEKFLLAISLMNHSYWTLGSIIGAIAGSVLPFCSEGIDFAMTALFVVVFIEQWMEKMNRIPEMIGVILAIVSLVIFGASSFVLPAMLSIIFVLLVARKKLDDKEEEVCR